MGLQIFDTDVFWKGCTNFGDYSGVGVNLNGIGFHAICQKKKHLKNSKYSGKRKVAALKKSEKQIIFPSKPDKINAEAKKKYFLKIMLVIS